MTHDNEPEHGGQDQPPEKPERTGMHPGIKALLVVLLGIPAVLIVLALLVFGACFLTS